jgi:hypothetical protein
VSTDAFVLECEVKNSLEQGGVIAFDTHLTVYSETGKTLEINLIDSKDRFGQFSFVRLGHELLDNRNTKQFLNVLDIDLQNWQKVKLMTQKGFFYVFLSDRQVIELPYPADFGELYGLGFAFKGCGAIRNLSLYRGDGSLAYQLCSNQ